MKFLHFGLVFLLTGIPNFLSANAVDAQSPPLTVVIVIDQLAHSHIRKLHPYFKHGFKYLLEKGINFTDAHHPHGITCTATGHAALGTGTFANKHGIILNSWRDENGKSQGFKDKNPNAAQFNGLHPTNVCRYGISAKNLMVNTVSDQFILDAAANTKNQVYSLSYKPRAAIGMGGHLGKSIWFDHNTVTFTSSKAFFDKLPQWLINFNKRNDLTKIKKVRWKTAYSPSSSAYNFENIHEYEHTSKKAPRANSTINTSCNRNDCACTNAPEGKIPFVKLPQANKLLLDLATNCLQTQFKPHRKEHGKFLLWVSLSTLDMIGHAYGPECLETVDMIYHLDKQLMHFIKKVEHMAGKRNVLFVLTADHGVSPIPELINRKKPGIAHRILQKNLLKKLNQAIHKQFGINRIVIQAKSNQFYLDKKILALLTEETKLAILERLKEIIREQPGIHEVWTSDELSKATFEPEQLESYYKNQHYPGRSGDLICMTKPYGFISKRTHGASHCSPYEDTTHVPLILYQAGKLQNKTIKSRVWIPQLPVTIAKILGVQPPSASPFQELPEILPKP